jgi:DNA-binding IclR family transcriptional regulator
MENEKNKTKTINSVETAFQIIEFLQSKDSVGVSQVSEQLELPRSTVHSYLTTLNQIGYLVNEDGKYQLSLRFAYLGEKISHYNKLIEIAEPAIRKLAQETGEQAILSVEEHGLVVNAILREGKNAIQRDFIPGERSRMFNTATGQVLLAFLSKREVDAIIQQWGIQKHTVHSLSTKSSLMKELEAIRNENISIVKGTFVNGLQEIAMPVFIHSDGNKDIYASVGIIGPSERFNEDNHRNAIVDGINKATNEIELELALNNID